MALVGQAEALGTKACGKSQLLDILRTLLSSKFFKIPGPMWRSNICLMDLANPGENIYLLPSN